MADRAGDYAWSSFAAHGPGEPNDLLDPAPAYHRTSDDSKAHGRRGAATSNAGRAKMKCKRLSGASKAACRTVQETGSRLSAGN